MKGTNIRWGRSGFDGNTCENGLAQLSMSQQCEAAAKKATATLRYYILVGA